MANSKTRKLDYTTLAGLAVALAGILGGLVLEKGQAQDVMQLTAALIVFGGTAGAVLISTPRANLRRALRRCEVLLFEDRRDSRAVVDHILTFATQARGAGIVSLEAQAEKLEDPFLRKGLMLAVDGVDTSEIRRQLELEIRLEEERADADARVFESAGGYAPTIGIIGAVLGLIQVMKRLDNIGEVGRGIAVAFVATVYGVGAANLLFFPAAARIRARAERESQERELMVEGILAIAEGLHPYLIRVKLENYLDSRPAQKERSKASGQTAAARSES